MAESIRQNLKVQLRWNKEGKPIDQGWYPPHIDVPPPILYVAAPVPMLLVIAYPLLGPSPKDQAAVEVNGKQTQWLVDSGATFTSVHSSLVQATQFLPGETLTILSFKSGQR